MAYTQATVGQSYGRVQLFVGGRLMELPWKAADDLAAALRTQARRAEEWEKAERVAQDQALLIRTGAPLGLTSHPLIQAEAAKQAAWDRDLRRYLPGGIKSKEQFGIPAVRNQK